MNPFIAMIITFAVALVELRLMDFAAHRGWIESRLSRKIIHILTGPLFVLCWLLFPDVWYARWLAALVPFAITLQFLLIGLGIMKDEASVKAMSRSGDRREILRGPLFYGIVFVVMTLVYWKTSPIGMVALMLMCGGDGLAEIMGRGLRSPKLPWSRDKSVAGSAGHVARRMVAGCVHPVRLCSSRGIRRAANCLPAAHHVDRPGGDADRVPAIKGY